jgi:hypothetical protein
LTDAAELSEMFADIQVGAGRAYITLKQLRRWDELVELVEAGFASQEAIDAYLTRLGISRVHLLSIYHSCHCHSCSCVYALRCVQNIYTPLCDPPCPDVHLTSTIPPPWPLNYHIHPCLYIITPKGIDKDTHIDMKLFGQFIHLLDNVMLDDLGNEVF